MKHQFPPLKPQEQINREQKIGMLKVWYYTTAMIAATGAAIYFACILYP